jgi:F0F1-type ATP synthase membrane subunit b/b'
MPPLAAVPDLEQELDELYALPLEEFTRTRNDLARRLKRAHQTEAAAEVQALRKPSVPAWAVNQLARSEPRLLGALLAAADEVRDAQVRALEGRASAAEVREATENEREAVRPLVTAARSLLGDRATPALLERVSQTLRAAALDEKVRPLLETGRLTEDVQAVGFGSSALAAVQPVKPRRDEVKRARQERLRALRAEARRLAEEAAVAEHALREAEQAVEGLRAEAAERRAAAEQAAAELREAESA